MFALIAFVCFLLAAFGVHLGSANLLAIGLAFVALALLFGNWPMGYLITSGRRVN